MYFYDANRVVICTEGFIKSSETPESAIDRAVALRKQYEIDKRTEQVNYLEIGDLADE